MREIIAGSARRGSTGQGVGEAVLDARRDSALALTVADCLDADMLRRKASRIFEAKVAEAEEIASRYRNRIVSDLLRHLKDDPFGEDHVSSLAMLFSSLIKVEESCEYLARVFAEGQAVMCEGAHGTLIDQGYGFPPFVTRRSTTALPILGMLQSIIVDARLFTVGVARAVAFRHGPGPFVTEDANAALAEKHNLDNPWQGKPRYGWFDAVAAKYAFDCNRRPDAVAVTMLDGLSKLLDPQMAHSYAIPIAESDDADQYFTLDGEFCGARRVVGIRPAEQQSPRLTALLNICKPLLISLGDHDEANPLEHPLADRRVNTLLSHVQSPDVFGRAPGILSFGPRREDKIITSALMSQILDR
jgi:adenylosuccinate synthase